MGRFPGLEAAIALKGLDATSLSALCGLSYQTFSAIRSGTRDRSPREIAAIAKATNFPPELLFMEPAQYEVLMQRVAKTLSVIADSRGMPVHREIRKDAQNANARPGSYDRGDSVWLPNADQSKPSENWPAHGTKRGYSREFTPHTDRRVRCELDRIPPTLYDAVTAKAKREGVSLRALTLTLWKQWIDA